MANSGNWIRHSGLVHLKTVLDELIDENLLDLVTLDPTNSDWNDEARVAYLRGGPDSHELIGVPGTDIDCDAQLLVRVYASKTATEGVSLALERIIAEVRDKIIEHISDFWSLDPPMQVEGLSLVDDPAFSMERDLSAATIEVRVRSHD